MCDRKSVKTGEWINSEKKSSWGRYVGLMSERLSTGHYFVGQRKQT